MSDLRELLFATQKPEEVVATVDRRKVPLREPWISFDDAVAARRAGREGEAAKALRRVLKTGREIRPWLWALNGLRSLGTPPAELWAGTVFGVVVEVPMPGGLDTMAAYSDGSARYINHAGKIIVWDMPAPSVLHPQFAALFPAAVELSRDWPPGRPERPEANQVGIAILSSDGPLFSMAPLAQDGVSGPAGPVFAAASQLLAALVAAAEQGAPAPAPEDPDRETLRYGRGDERWQALGRIMQRGPQVSYDDLLVIVECLPGAEGPLKLLILTLLGKLGAGAVAALRASASGHPNPEVRAQAGVLLDGI